VPKDKTIIMFRPDQPFVTIITALTRARLSLCALGLWHRLSLLGGDEDSAVMRFFGVFRDPFRHRSLMLSGGLKRTTCDGARALVCELLSRDKGK
jgi:hypothetical protein